jgi:hypothetical protein
MSFRFKMMVFTKRGYDSADHKCATLAVSALA